MEQGHERFAKSSYNFERRTKRLLFSIFKIRNKEDFLLKTILFISVIALASSFSYNLWLYNTIPSHWKAAITIFIVLLPFCYFLQASLNVRATREDRISEIQTRFREYYMGIMNEVNKRMSELIRGEVLNNLAFRGTFTKIASLISDTQIYHYYQMAYEIYVRREEKFLENETIRLLYEGQELTGEKYTEIRDKLQS